MNTVVHYFQSCPVCGRALRIRVSLLGKHVYCQHCGGGFRATDPATRRAPVAEPHDAAVPSMAILSGNGDGRYGTAPCGDDLLRRVEVVLRRAEQVRSGGAMETAGSVGCGAGGCAADADRDVSSPGR